MHAGGRERMRRASVALSALGLTAPKATAETTAPARWDPRVEKYVRFVERHRKLEFEHPVPVKFLADDAFVKAYQRDDPKITKQDRADAEQSPVSCARSA